MTYGGNNFNDFTENQLTQICLNSKGQVFLNLVIPREHNSLPPSLNYTTSLDCIVFFSVV